MANIHIKRKHNLSHSEAKVRVEELAKDLKNKLGASYQWDGDSLRFQRAGASGSISIGEQVVEVNVKIGLVLAPMKGMIECSIHEGFDVVLAESSDRGLA